MHPRSCSKSHDRSQRTLLCICAADKLKNSDILPLSDLIGRDTVRVWDFQTLQLKHTIKLDGASGIIDVKVRLHVSHSLTSRAGMCFEALLPHCQSSLSFSAVVQCCCATSLRVPAR